MFANINYFYYFFMNNFLAPHSVVLFSLFFIYNFTKSPCYVADNLFIDLVEWRTVILLLLLLLLLLLELGY